MNSSPSTLHIPTPRLSGLILNSASPPSRRRPSRRPGFVLLIAPNGECLCLQLLVLSASLHCLPGTREVYGGYCGPLMNAVALPARLLSLLPGSLFDAPGGPLCRPVVSRYLDLSGGFEPPNPPSIDARRTLRPYRLCRTFPMACPWFFASSSVDSRPRLQVPFHSLPFLPPAPHGYCMAHPSRSL
jgi:hypothetical protein